MNSERIPFLRNIPLPTSDLLELAEYSSTVSRTLDESPFVDPSEQDISLERVTLPGADTIFNFHTYYKQPSWTTDFTISNPRIGHGIEFINDEELGVWRSNRIPMGETTRTHTDNEVAAFLSIHLPGAMESFLDTEVAPGTIRQAAALALGDYPARASTARFVYSDHLYTPGAISPRHDDDPVILLGDARFSLETSEEVEHHATTIHTLSATAISETLAGPIRRTYSFIGQREDGEISSVEANLRLESSTIPYSTMAEFAYAESPERVAGHLWKAILSLEQLSDTTDATQH